MSTRYSLRQTPKKVEHAGFVETPRPRGPNRRKSQFPDDGEDSSSAGDSSSKRPASTTRRSSRNISLVEKATTNGYASGYANGETNGNRTKMDNHTNVHPNGTNYAATNGHSDSKAFADAEKKLGLEHKKVIDGWEVGTDPKVDKSGHFDFGGSWGVSVMMICFPTLMYYMWIGATFYEGKLPTPKEGESFVEFVEHMGNLVYEHAFPSLYAWILFWTFLIFEAACYCLMPGVYTYGKPLPHEGGKQLKYYCSAVSSWYTTIVVMGILHFTGIFPLYTIIDEFGSIMSVAICSGFIVSFIAYFSALSRGAQHRMTGYPFYDFFMGAELNPRMFGILDMKMFFEVRLPWFILFGLSSATAARQYENYGYVSGEVGLMVLAHFLYANACAKGEELITTTWDIYYEKWGFMLIFWNFAGVPLSYCHSTLYLANHHPGTYRWNRYFIGALYVAYLFVYWVWDTTNSQKNRFRAAEKGTLLLRKTFPQLPWQTVKNPRTITSKAGDTILVDGWYGYARKIHYTCDMFFALSWGLVTGFKSPFPWFYPVFFCGMIMHRTFRDNQRCQRKYGEAWDEYIKTVPYLFIPVAAVIGGCVGRIGGDVAGLKTHK